MFIDSELPEINQKSFFIAFEGIDGAGKTTQANLLVKSLSEYEWGSIYLKEPTNGKWGKKIREIASIGRESITLEDELEYFINDRAEDVENNIAPALSAGKVVVMDRYYFSNMAYQSALGIDIKIIKEKNRHFPKPDITFFLDLKPSDGLLRIDNRTGGANIGYEKKEFLEKVYKIFKSDHFKDMVPIDASESIEEIHAEILKIVLDKIKKA